MRTVEFQVVDCKPGAFGLVVADTIIDPGREGETLAREHDPMNEIGYEDIGGLKKQLGKIREMVELPIRFPQLFRTLGVKPPKGEFPCDPFVPSGEAWKKGVHICLFPPFFPLKLLLVVPLCPPPTSLSHHLQVCCYLDLRERVRP